MQKSTSRNVSGGKSMDMPLSSFFHPPGEGLVATTFLFATFGFFFVPMLNVQNLINRTPILDTLTYYCDPIIFNLMGGIPILLFVMLLFRGHFSMSRSQSVLLGLVATVAIGGFIIFGEYFLEKIVLKKSFLIDRPADPLPQPFLLAWAHNLISDYEGPGTSTPSGFTMRQLLLALFYIYASNVTNMKYNKWERNAHIASIFFSFFLVLFTAYLRVYRGAHTFIDIGMAFGIGVVIFLIVAGPLALLIDMKWKLYHRLIMLFAACSSIIWFFYASNVPLVALSFFLIFLYFGLVELVSPYTQRYLYNRLSINHRS